MEPWIATFVTLLVTIDPIGVAPMFAGLTAQHSPAERRRMALRGVAIAAGVLVGFALIGELLLSALGIELAAFRIAGGVLLLLLSIDMVMVRHSGLRTTTASEEEESGQRADISVFPLAIPLVAGPGAMTSVVLLMSAAAGDVAGSAVVLGELLLVLALTLGCFLGAGRLMKLLGITGVNVITRVSGLLLAALAVQFGIDGVRAVLAG
ncbi:MAG: MarC family protein [Planctomycetes bacterium]|nr:MarC family protein [Planctomycetota bacterium]